MNSEAKQKADALLKQMTVDEMVGQLNEFSGMVMAHLSPHLRHAAEGQRGRCEDGAGALTARAQQDHARCLYAGSGFQ